MTTPILLTETEHNCSIAKLNYVYPVISRRVGGLSIGINFNVNNACNWRCIYCQVPNLQIGSAPELDSGLLVKELRYFLYTVQHGDFYEQFNVSETQRQIKDIAISGNGEPTSLKNFAEAVALIGDIAHDLGVLPHSRYILITNGSLIHLPQVQRGLKVLKEYGGEVWFKFDSANDNGKQSINHASQNCIAGLSNLLLSASLCPTKIQTCLLDYDNQGFIEGEKIALLNAFAFIKAQSNIKDIMLYTLARQSHQPEANKLKALSNTVMNAFAEEIRELGFNVSVN